jgi:hypothetical protein
MQCACAILSSLNCLAVQYVSTLSHKLHNFEKKRILKKCVFWFSIRFLSETFLVLRRNERDMIKNVCLFTYLFTYSMEQSPSWEANWFAASQEIPRILWNTKVHYRIHKCRSRMFSDLYVKSPLFLSDFIETWMFFEDFRKIPKYQISWKFVQWQASCSMQMDREATDGQTYITKVIVAFRNFRNAPKKDED